MGKNPNTNEKMPADDDPETCQRNYAEDMTHAANSMNQGMRPAGIEIAKDMMRSLIREMLQATPDSASLILKKLWRSLRQGSWETGQNLAPPTLEELQAWNNFVKQYLCLQRDRDIDLRSLKRTLDGNARDVKNHPRIHMAFLKLLTEMNHIWPVKDPHWRSNRNARRTSDRMRFDLEKYLEMLPKDGPARVILEMGMGNGSCRRDLMKYVRKEDTYVGISDRLYYQIEDLLERVIDFDALAAAGAPVEGEARQTLCRFLYKVLAIKDGKTKKLRLPYDEEVLTMLRTDPNSLVTILQKKQKAIRKTQWVPDEDGEPDEDSIHDAVYRKHDPRPSDPGASKALNLLSGKDFRQFLRIGAGKPDAYEFLPVHLESQMIGDFSEIHRMQDNQVDLMFGSRSTVYIDNKTYLREMFKASSMLTDEGLYVGDCTRFNYGIYYRIGELVELQKRIAAKEAQEKRGKPPMKIWVIVGNGFDKMETGMKVPVGMIMTRSKSKAEAAAQCIYRDAKNCELKSPDELNTKEYMDYCYSWQERKRPEVATAS